MPSPATVKILGVIRIHYNFVDWLRITQSEMRPGFAGHPADLDMPSPRKSGRCQTLAAANIMMFDIRSAPPQRANASIRRSSKI